MIKIRYFVFGSAVLLLLWIIVPVALWSWKGAEKAGQVGDIFGAVNALFSGLAFGGLILAILYQREELQLQRKELKHQRDELKLTRGEFETQNSTLAAQRFENTLFQLLRTHNDIVQSIRYRPASGGPAIEGRECFKYYFDRLKASYTKNNGSLSAVGCYERLYKEIEPHVGHYFRHLYHVVKFVDDSAEPAEKRKYSKFIRAQLSSNESVLLFYNCASPHGQNFKRLIEKFALLQTLSFDRLIDPGQRDLYDASAFGSND